MLPRTLRNFSLFVEGEGYAGRCTEITLPTLGIQMEEYRAGGLDATVEIDMGMETLEGSFVLAEYNEDIIGRFGLMDQGATEVKARGALMRNGDEDAVAVVCEMRGGIKNFDPGSMEAGAVTEASFTMAIRYYKLTIAGDDVIEIDVENMKRIINGEDQLSSIREAMGVGSSEVTAEE